jgi:hypothetical protein
MSDARPPDPPPLENVNVAGFEEMPTPEAIHAQVPLSNAPVGRWLADAP